MSKVAKHKDICQNLNTLYEIKNRKYGDSFTKTYQEYGPAMLCIRLDDKLGRLKMLLLHKEKATPDESVFDTLMDIANYAIMGVIEIAGDSDEYEY